MPYVRGFLKLGRPSRPSLPDRPTDPDYGIEEGGNIDNELPGEMPDPPPGIWPPLTPEQPWRPIGGVDPGYGLPGPRPPTAGQPLPRPPSATGRPDQGLPGEGEHPEVQPPMVLPPGAIWPPLPPDVHGKYLALVLIAGTPGYKYRYVVIDADALPKPGHPIAPGGPDTPQPKR